MAVELGKYVCKPVYGFMHPLVENAILRDPVPADSFRRVADNRYGKWHEPLIDKYVKWISGEVTGLTETSWTGFKKALWSSYPTMGSEEAI